MSILHGDVTRENVVQHTVIVQEHVQVEQLANGWCASLANKGK
jgi:hypothetical protein